MMIHLDKSVMKIDLPMPDKQLATMFIHLDLITVTTHPPEEFKKLITKI